MEALRDRSAALLLSSGTRRPTTRFSTSAASGELKTGRRRREDGRRMLENPKARDGVDEFVSQWLRFDRVLASRASGVFTRCSARSLRER